MRYSSTQTEILQRARSRRALLEYPNYRFQWGTEFGTIAVINPEGNGYLVSPTRCTCPDHRHLKGTGVRCKHREMAQIWVSEQSEAAPEPQPEPARELAAVGLTPEKRARVERDRARLWD